MGQHYVASSFPRNRGNLNRINAGNERYSNGSIVRRVMGEDKTSIVVVVT
jgi:hypothetical protein